MGDLKGFGASATLSKLDSISYAYASFLPRLAFVVVT